MYIHTVRPGAYDESKYGRAISTALEEAEREPISLSGRTTLVDVAGSTSTGTHRQVLYDLLLLQPRDQLLQQLVTRGSTE